MLTLLSICMIFSSTVTLVQSSIIKQHSSSAFDYSDALVAPDLPHRRFEALSDGQSPSPGYYETSEYLIGSVAVGIILLESNGTIDPSTEDWSSTQESWVWSEISGALTWLENYNPNADISFVFDIHLRVPTSYEPINHLHTDQYLWINEAMTYLGYAGASYFTQVRDYINDLRDTLDTDWAFTIFLANSYNDWDGEFTDGYSAYAYLGGPFFVMTYDNDGYGIGNMDFVAAHETCHIFYATDEYNGVTETSGYLGVQDHEGSGCMMDRALSWWLCGASREQLGWRDSDSDGIQDILDTLPNTAIDPYSPDPTNETILTYTGNVTVTPYPNNNPYGWGRDITINTITNVEFRDDTGQWSTASSTDGSFDEAEESFRFTTSPFAAGNHTIETRGINSVFNIETSYASDEVSTLSPYGTVVYSTSSPERGATNGLAWDGTALWVSGAFSGMIYRFNPYTNMTLTSFNGPTMSLRDVAWDGNNVWVTSWNPRAVYKLDPSDGTVLFSFSPPFSGHPDGLTWDGQYLWVGEEDSRIYKVDPSSGSAVSSFSVPYEPIYNPRGLAWDGANIWAGYQAVSLIKRHSTTGSVLASFESPSTGQQGLAWDGQYLWSTGGDNMIYRISVQVVIRVPRNYQTIQEAINSAKPPGYLIRVAPGTYYEHIIVNKTVSLVGENREATIIDGNRTTQTLVKITADDVTLTNFTIQRAGEMGFASQAEALYLLGSRVSVTSNIIRDSNKGIFIRPLSNSNQIIDNVITGNFFFGIDCGSSNNRIIGNSVVGNTPYDGIIMSSWLKGPLGEYWPSGGNVLRGNNLTQNGANFGIEYGGWVSGGELYPPPVSAFVQDIDTSNLVDGKPIYYILNSSNTIIDNVSNIGYLGLINSKNVTIRNLTLTTSNYQGMLLANVTDSTVETVYTSARRNQIALIWSNNNVITNSTFVNAWSGIHLVRSDNNTIYQNDVAYGSAYGRGIRLDKSIGNAIVENSIRFSRYGISFLWGSVQNVIFHNNFISNTDQLYGEGFQNIWDNGYEGNYWSDYNGTDTNEDGVGDTYLPWQEVDYYPLMNPYLGHNIAIVNIQINKTIVGQGGIQRIDVEVVNVGSFPQTFNVTLYANTTLIQTKTITLTAGESTVVSFYWNTTGVSYGNYTISAYAWPVPDETHTANNMNTDGTIFVSFPGDVNGDGKVDSADLIDLSKAYGSTSSTLNWNPNYDINGDNKVDISDLFDQAKNYGETVQIMGVNIVEKTSLTTALRLFMVLSMLGVFVGKRKLPRKLKN